MNTLNKISVCYLARFESKKSFQGDLEKLNKFLASYKKYKSGIEHTLWVIVKGNQELKAVSILKNIDIKMRILVVEDSGFDLGSYTNFAKLIRPEWLFLLNSNSEIMCDDWLLKFWKIAQTNKLSALGSMASFGSYSDGGSVDFYKIRSKNIWCYLRQIRDILNRFKYSRLFPKYPNPHIRTNALLVKSEDWLLYFTDKKIETKLDCYKFESGNDSFYNFIVNKYGNFGIVGRDMVLRFKNEWYFNGAFRTPLQDDYLLVSDNQTRTYSQSNNPLFRERLQFESWRRVDFNGT